MLPLTAYLAQPGTSGDEYEPTPSSQFIRIRCESFRDVCNGWTSSRTFAVEYHGTSVSSMLVYDMNRGVIVTRTAILTGIQMIMYTRAIRTEGMTVILIQSHS
jgi:hypothetical protein